MAGIPTANILQPGNISIVGGVNRALISNLQLLTPQWYNQYTEKYGNEDLTWWLATYGGMETVKNRDFFWFENRGKLMEAITIAVGGTSTNGSTVNLTMSSVDNFNAGTQGPLRVGESFYGAKDNIGWEILTINTATPNAWTFTARPKLATTTATIAAGDILIFGGDMDAGEASNSIEPLIHLDQKYSNTITEMRDDWSATDLAEMTEVFYSGGVSGEVPAGGGQAGVSYFTYKGLVKANQRFKNYVEMKLMRGDVVTNTGLNSNGTSVGTQGFIPKVLVDGETVGYTPGVLDIAKMHEITRIMDVNGCVSENLWLQDIYQRQNFSDGLFKEYPAGAWVWGSNDKSEEAAISYGVQSLMIDGYLLKVKKYRPFNTEYYTGKTPDIDYFRNFGIICPQGTVRDAKDAGKTYKNMQVMVMEPPKGGSIGNGIRVWQTGGASMNPTTGQMVDQVHMICYRGMRIVAANQFIIVQAA